jgi:flagellar biosynthetic protein FlhB
MYSDNAWSGIWLQQHYWQGLAAVLQVTAPLFGGVMLAGIIGSIGQTGPYFSWEAFQAGGLKALDPIKGAKKLFSAKSVTTLLMTLAKIGLIAGVITLMWRRKWMTVAQLHDFELVSAVGWMMHNLYTTVMAVVVLAIGIAVVDAVITHRRHEKSMMMSKHEVKDEHKQYEMKPEVKRAQFRKMRTLTLSRMVAEVPKATVIITNPTRVAVAIKYNPAEMDAPQVVAKGLRIRAKRIRELAAKHGIPIVERPPLARALYRTVPTGRSIPSSLFEGVAEVLAYLHRLGYRLDGLAAQNVPVATASDQEGERSSWL